MLGIDAKRKKRERGSNHGSIREGVEPSGAFRMGESEQETTRTATELRVESEAKRELKPKKGRSGAVKDQGGA